MSTSCRRRIQALWCSEHESNAWVWLSGAGWRKLDDSNRDACTNLPDSKELKSVTHSVSRTAARSRSVARADILVHTSQIRKRSLATCRLLLEKGPSERSLRGLYDARAQLRQGETKELQALGFAFHSRLALILSPVAFAILAFGVVSIGRDRWSAVVAAIGLVVAVIAVVWFDGPANGWPPLLRAYTPDLIFGTLGAVLLRCSVKWPDRNRAAG